MGEGAVVTLVGAGGKTTAMFRLAAELRAAGGGVVVTTTTRILVPPRYTTRELVVDLSEPRLVRGVERVVSHGRIAVVGASVGRDGKLSGIPCRTVAALADLDAVTHVLVEADGAAGRPFKAPRRGEPVVPACTTVLVVVVGADAIGARLDAVAHHVEPILALTGARAGDRVDTELVARVLTHRRGGTKGAPPRARVVHLVNKADTPQRARIARDLALRLRSAGATRVVVAACRRASPIVAVVDGATRQTRESGRSAARAPR